MGSFLTLTHLLTEEDYKHLVQKRGHRERRDVGYKLYFDPRQSYYVITYTDETGKTEVIAICLGTHLSYDLYDTVVRKWEE
jgi:hypothetical protein